MYCFCMVCIGSVLLSIVYWCIGMLLELVYCFCIGVSSPSLAHQRSVYRISLLLLCLYWCIGLNYQVYNAVLCIGVFVVCLYWCMVLYCLYCLFASALILYCCIDMFYLVYGSLLCFVYWCISPSPAHQRLAYKISLACCVLVYCLFFCIGALGFVFSYCVL